MRAALDTLPEADRDVLVLRNFEGLSYEEIGFLRQVEPAAARQRHARALLRLHRTLFGDPPAESQP